MADQRSWFKLWCSALDDPDLDNLSLDDFARWAKLGALVKRHGTAGSLTFAPPARTLCSMFQVPDFRTLLVCIMRLPGVRVSSANGPVSHETVTTVSFSNWAKYQDDLSTERVRRFRERKRLRREENRTDEMRGEETSSPPTEEKTITPPVVASPRHPPRRPAGEERTQTGFDRFWAEYPRKIGKGKAQRAWKTAKAEALTDQIVAAVVRQRPYLEREGSKYTPLPTTWLNQRRWDDEPPQDFIHTATKARMAPGVEWLRLRADKAPPEKETP